MKFCPNCGKKLEENADVCLNCGKFLNNNNNNKEIKKNSKIGIFGILVIILSCIIGFTIMMFALIVLLLEEDDFYYDDYPDTSVHDIIENSGSIGDTLYYNNLEISLNSVNVYDYLDVNNEKKIPRNGNQYVVLNLTVRNDSEFDYNLDISNFTGYYNGDEINKIHIEGVNDNRILNGSIIGNKSMKGNIIFEIKKDWSYFELYYHEKNDLDRVIFKIISSTYNDNIKK